METTLYGRFYNAAICCILSISIRWHNKQPHKWPDKNEGEIWGCVEISMASACLDTVTVNKALFYYRFREHSRWEFAPSTNSANCDLNLFVHNSTASFSFRSIICATDPSLWEEKYFGPHWANILCPLWCHFVPQSLMFHWWDNYISQETFFLCL